MTNKIKKLMLNGTEYLIREWVNPFTPTTFSYDFRGGSLAGFQAAGGETITTNGSYTIDSNGLGQTSSSTDRWTSAFVPLPTDWSDGASKLTISRLGYYAQYDWAGPKKIGICTNTTDEMGRPSFWSQMHFNTVSPGSYSDNGIFYGASSSSTTVLNRTYYASTSGDTTQTMEIDLITGAISYTTTGADVHSFSYTLSSSQLTELKGMGYIIYNMKRGYSNNNTDRMKTVSFSIE